MYHLEITTKGFKEHFQSNEVTQIHKAIHETLQKTSITYVPKMLVKIRQLQNKLKPLATNDFIVWNIEKSIIKIEAQK